MACTVHCAAAVTQSIGTAIEWVITFAAAFIASETGKHQLDHA